MTDSTTATRPAEEPTEPKPRLLEMSATQLIGGALAAMTAAVIGARLGVAGTVLGAAIGSVVAGAAGSLYTASLKHTRNKLTSAFVGRVGGTPVTVSTVQAGPTAVDRAATGNGTAPGYGVAPGHASDDRAAGSSTKGWATQDWTTQDGYPSPPAASAPPSAEAVATAADVDATGRSVSRRPWRAILVSTAVVFLLAIAGLTTFELLSGQAVSGGQGTTLTQVGEGRSSGSNTPVEAPSAETSTSPTAEPSATPSTETSAAPSSEPTASTAPTTQTTQTPAPSTSTEPSATETPSAATSADPQASEPGTTAGG